MIRECCGDQSSTHLEKLAAQINTQFQQERPAYEVLTKIREFPKPIAVDFNNVVANNRFPLELNPAAPQFLEKIRRVGNIFIITSASSWESLQDFLDRHNLWYPEMVLMTVQTYQFLSKHQINHPDGQKLRSEFLEMSSKLGWSYSEQDLLAPPKYKKVAPIFLKPWQIPLIDDNEDVTNNNPGMFGITVQHWEPTLEQESWYKSHNAQKFTLSQAAAQVSNHYASLGTFK